MRVLNFLFDFVEAFLRKIYILLNFFYHSKKYKPKETDHDGIYLLDIYKDPRTDYVALFNGDMSNEDVPYHTVKNNYRYTLHYEKEYLVLIKKINIPINISKIPWYPANLFIVFGVVAIIFTLLLFFCFAALF